MGDHQPNQKCFGGRGRGVKQVTIYDVSRLAKVSISTVSNAVNRPDKVSAATRQRVLDAINSLGFVPKDQAIARARRDLGYVGVLAPFTSYPSFWQRLAGVLERATSGQTEVVVMDHPSASTASTFVEAAPVARRLDGLIIMSLPLEPAARSRLLDSELPTVLVDTTDEGFTSVMVDDTAGGRMVADAFVERGHRRVAFLGEKQQVWSKRSAVVRRLGGFEATLAAAGTPLDPALIQLVASSPTDYAKGAWALLDRPDRPTAIFAYSDTAALSCLRVAHDLGLRVPDDVAIVGFDDLDWAAATGLTTVRQPLQETGSAAMTALRGLMDETEIRGRRTVLPVQLVLRDTL